MHQQRPKKLCNLHGRSNHIEKIDRCLWLYKKIDKLLQQPTVEEVKEAPIENTYLNIYRQMHIHYIFCMYSLRKSHLCYMIQVLQFQMEIQSSFNFFLIKLTLGRCFSYFSGTLDLSHIVKPDRKSIDITNTRKQKFKAFSSQLHQPHRLRKFKRNKRLSNFI